MRAQIEFESVWGLTRAAQTDWLRQLRSRTTHVELLFHDGDGGHPLTDALAWLNPSRSVDVGLRPGYSRRQDSAVLHRYPYDRAIFKALEDLGGLFLYSSAPAGDHVEFTGLGNIDVTLLDERDEVLVSTVTHEGVILTPKAVSAESALVVP